MASLFDKDFRYTQSATDFEAECYTALRPIFDRWVERGWSPRELSHIISAIAHSDLECSTILGMEAENAKPLAPVSNVPSFDNPTHVGSKVCPPEVECMAVRCQNAEGKTRHCGSNDATDLCNGNRGLCTCKCEGCTYLNRD